MMLSPNSTARRPIAYHQVTCHIVLELSPVPMLVVVNIVEIN